MSLTIQQVSRYYPEAACALDWQVPSVLRDRDDVRFTGWIPEYKNPAAKRRPLSMRAGGRHYKWHDAAGLWVGLSVGVSTYPRRAPDLRPWVPEYNDDVRIEEVFLGWRARFISPWT